MKQKKAMLIILDGWGYSKKTKGNAIKLAKTKNLAHYYRTFPHSLLKCSGKSVGLPGKQAGNSEVGHMTIGAGRVIDTDLARINRAIKNRDFFKNKTFLNAIRHVKKHNSALHFIGLLSDGGVHSHINHLFALLKLAKQQGIKKRIYIHCILDGRDSKPRSAKRYFNKLFSEIKRLGVNASIATVMGRFYGMDRDNRWHREHKAYDAMVNKKGRLEIYKQLGEYIKLQNQHICRILDEYYKRNITDEFIPPTITGRGTVEEEDSIIFFNFRSDRARELTRAFVEGRFKGFKRKKILKLNFVCLTQYDSKIRAGVAFPPLSIKNSLGEIVSKLRKEQLRVAETEKYAHATFFLNCGRERPFEHESRILIPSPKVKTYDQKPEMSAFKIAKAVSEAIKKKPYLLVIINFANGDMVGHTGSLKAAIKACKAVDRCVGKVVKTATLQEHTVIITADHGNCEDMAVYQTSHTPNPVPFIILSKEFRTRNGTLADIAPTLLKIMRIKKPKEMTGKSLIIP